MFHIKGIRITGQGEVIPVWRTEEFKTPARAGKAELIRKEWTSRNKHCPTGSPQEHNWARLA